MKQTNKKSFAPFQNPFMLPYGTGPPVGFKAMRPRCSVYLHFFSTVRDREEGRGRGRDGGRKDREKKKEKAEGPSDSQDK